MKPARPRSAPHASSATRETFERYAATYSETVTRSFGPLCHDHGFFAEQKAIAIAALLERRCPGGDLKVLDVGCGTGMLHPHLTGRVAELHGVDLSPSSIAVAAKANPSAHYHVSGGERLPFEDGSFDCALAACVLHHVPVAHWADFVREMLRVVRPGGLVAAIENNPLNPVTRWVVSRSEVDRDAVLLKPSELRSLLRGAGATSIEASYLLFTPFRPRPFRALDIWLKRVPFGAQYLVSGLMTGEP